jgi:protein N-terminal glutamine amidohydrolase
MPWDGILARVDRIDRERLDYQAFYCEENVWRFLARPEYRESATWAVIASNDPREVVVLRQRSGRPVDGLVHWDYHVFAVVADPVQGRLAYDLDSDLPFPCPLDRYLGESFPSEVQRAFAPKFRVMSGSDYVTFLVSDRSHMRRQDGTWIAPPPSWPVPGAGTAKPSLFMEWVDLRRRSPGTVMDAQRMAAFAAEARR